MVFLAYVNRFSIEAYEVFLTNRFPVNSRSPARELAKIAIPTSLEMLLQSSFGFIDQIIIGSMGAASIAAVGFANSTSVLLIMTFASLGSAAAILVARAGGAQDRSRLSYLASLGVSVAAILSIIPALPLALFAAPVMRSLGTSEEVVVVGWQFFAFLVAVAPLVVANAVMSQILRLLGKAKTPLGAALVAIAINTFFAYSFVFGEFGLPKLGLIGVGIAIVVANLSRGAIMFSALFGATKKADWKLPTGSVRKDLMAEITKISLPLQGSKFAWAGGVFLYAVIAANLGTAAMAANQIVISLESMFLMGSSGIVNASSAMINKALGQGDSKLARAWVRTSVKGGIITGAVFTTLFLVAIHLLPKFYPKVDPHVLNVAYLGGLWLAAIQIGKVFNMMNGSSLLASGGDAKGVFYGDTFGAYLVGLPIAYMGGMHWGWGAISIFIAKAAEDVFKVFFFGNRLRKIKWSASASPQPGGDVMAELDSNILPAEVK